MKKIKMIGLDLDGTLLNDKKELTSHTREILTRAIDQGARSSWSVATRKSAAQ